MALYRTLLRAALREGSSPSPKEYGEFDTWLIDLSKDTLSNGNLAVERTAGAAAWSTNYSTLPKDTGTSYIEVTCNNAVGNTSVGIVRIGYEDVTTYLGRTVGSLSWGGGSGNWYTNEGSLGFYATWGTGDVISVAMDHDTGDVWVAKNGVWQSGNPSTLTSPSHGMLANTPHRFATGRQVIGEKFTVNAGQSPFIYPVPTGFNAGWYK